MKKQFNRMRQLASQNLGRSVFSLPPALLQTAVMLTRLLLTPFYGRKGWAALLA